MHFTGFITNFGTIFRTAGQLNEPFHLKISDMIMKGLGIGSKEGSVPFDFIVIRVGKV